METLEVPKSVREGLVRFANLREITSQALEIILQSVVQNVFSVKQPDTVVSNILQNLQTKNVLEPFDEQGLATVVENLTTLFSIFVRQGATDEIMRKYLANCGWENPKIETFVTCYSANKHKIKAYLSLFRDSVSRLVDVNWRLDFRHKNGQLGITKDLVYIIEFKLANGDRQETVQFYATKPELEDLVSMLRDASQSLKRAAS